MVDERPELRGVAALEAVDRLLVVADREQGPPAFLGLARPGEQFLGERPDDVELGGVGVLRLVDQDMVDLAVELEAHPVAHPRTGEQPAGPGDEVVEVGDPGAALGEGVSLGERLARAKPRRHLLGQPGAALDGEQLRQSPRQGGRRGPGNRGRP